jgi:uncharacterized cupredoxin-like copper-binding protein
MLFVGRNCVVRHVLLPVLLLMLTVGAVVACGQTTSGSSTTPTTAPTTAATSQPSMAAITVTASEYSFTLPQTVPAGLVDMTLMNNGTLPHAAQLVQLNSGVTPGQFQSALLQKGLLVMRTLGTIMGGPNVADPGKSSEVILTLSDGQYAVVSPVLGKDGKRDFQKGMIASFTVTGSAPTGQAATLTATAQITMKSFSYSAVPATIPAGTVTLQVMNVGQEPYEFDVVKLAPGKTAQDVKAFLTHPSGPPPYVDIGGMCSISPGLSGWVKFNLTAGNYVALSHVFDMATGKPEFLLGMLTSFTVQ